MTVKFLVGYDRLMRPRPFRYAHEETGGLRICQSLWDRLHGLEEIFYVIENPAIAGGAEISPDLVIVSSLGLGIVEMKDWQGKIEWKPKDKKPAFKQVQEYGECIRNELLVRPKTVLSPDSINPTPLPTAWLPGMPTQHNDKPKLHTTVCYTHPKADLVNCRHDASRRAALGDKPAPWEKFQITTAGIEISSWAASLRWEVSTGFHDLYNSYRLSVESLDTLARLFFNARAVPDVEKLVTGVRKVHAFLKWLDYPNLKPERLDREQYIMGRNPETCDILFPSESPRISNEHLRLTVMGERFFIEDLSTNGTYLADGTPIQGQQQIVFGQRVLCGGKLPGEKVCQLMLVKPPENVRKKTEIATQT